MSPRKDTTPKPDSRVGLSFAFPMRLPESGTGVGNTQAKPAQAQPGRQDAPKPR